MLTFNTRICAVALLAATVQGAASGTTCADNFYVPDAGQCCNADDELETRQAHISDNRSCPGEVGDACDPDTDPLNDSDPDTPELCCDGLVKGAHGVDELIVGDQGDDYGCLVMGSGSGNDDVESIILTFPNAECGDEFEQALDDALTGVTVTDCTDGSAIVTLQGMSLILQDARTEAENDTLVVPGYDVSGAALYVDPCAGVTCTAATTLCKVIGTCNAADGVCSAETDTPCSVSGETCDAADGVCKTTLVLGDDTPTTLNASSMVSGSNISVTTDQTAWITEALKCGTCTGDIDITKIVVGNTISRDNWEALPEEERNAIMDAAKLDGACSVALTDGTCTVVVGGTTSTNTKAACCGADPFADCPGTNTWALTDTEAACTAAGGTWTVSDMAAKLEGLNEPIRDLDSIISSATMLSAGATLLSLLF